jgi:hypothetical protein
MLAFMPRTSARPILTGAVVIAALFLIFSFAFRDHGILSNTVASLKRQQQRPADLLADVNNSTLGVSCSLFDSPSIDDDDILVRTRWPDIYCSSKKSSSSIYRLGQIIAMPYP